MSVFWSPVRVADLPQVEIARRFQVCPATVSNWRRQEREEGRRKPKPHSGGVPSRLDAAAVEVLRQLVAEDNDALLREYRERLTERAGVTVCLAVICEALKRLKLRPKKRPFGQLSRTGPRSRLSVRLTASR